MVVKKEKEGLHLKALKFFEFKSLKVVNVQEQQLPQQQQQQLVVVENAVLFVVVALFVFVCASCQVHVAEKPLRSCALRPIGEEN